jgi:hypothetical protein
MSGKPTSSRQTSGMAVRTFDCSSGMVFDDDFMPQRFEEHGQHLGGVRVGVHD